MRLVNFIRSNWGVALIALLALTLRIIGVGYGLPQFLVGDEPPFSLVALQMLQQHVFIPAVEPEAFKSILLYPPYMSYVLLIPFTLILGSELLTWHGGIALFPAHALSDLSPFFIAARMLDVVLGVLSVYLTYLIAKQLFRTASPDGARIAALLAAFLVATSILHEALSMVGRHWMVASAAFLCVLFILTREGWGRERRYLLASLIAGLGVGFTTVSALAPALIGLYYMLFDFRRAEWRTDALLVLKCAGLFFALAAVPFMLTHGANAFVGSITLSQAKTAAGLLMSPVAALELQLFSEPVLIVGFLFGLGLLVARGSRAGIFIGAWFLTYCFAFYVLFRFDPRFLVPLIPFYAIAGGYALSLLWRRHVAVVLCIFLAVPLVVSLRLSYLVLHDDTRAQARQWVLDNLAPTDKVMVVAPLMRIETNRAAVDELRALDQGDVRKVDEADAALDRADLPYVLNDVVALHEGNALTRDPQRYAREHGFRYLVIAPETLAASSTSAFKALTGGTVLARFDGLGDDMSITNSSFTRLFTEFFRRTSLGPTVVIYRI